MTSQPDQQTITAEANLEKGPGGAPPLFLKSLDFCNHFEELQTVLIEVKLVINNAVKTGKNTKGINPSIRYVCDTSNSFIYYTTRDGEDKSNMYMPRDTKRSNQNP